MSKFLAVMLGIVIVMMLAVPGDAQAQPAPTPTPTPSLAPVLPTPTSKYAGLRPTPPPWNIAPVTPISDLDTENIAGSFADTIINSYRFINSTGVLDVIAFFALVLFMIVLAVTLKNNLEQNE
jgi:hypothetical protein